MVFSGHMMKSGTIVDAAIIDAPSSTKNAEKKRVPEIHLGTKCHTDVDAGSGLGPYYRGHHGKRTQRNSCVQVNPRGRRGGVRRFQISGIQKQEDIQADPHLASIYYRINVVPRVCRRYQIGPSTGSGISSAGSPLCAARWSAHFALSNGSSFFIKFHVRSWQRTNAGFRTKSSQGTTWAQSAFLKGIGPPKRGI